MLMMSYSDHFLSFISASIRLLTLSKDNSSKATDAICPYWVRMLLWWGGVVGGGGGVCV